MSLPQYFRCTGTTLNKKPEKLCFRHKVILGYILFHISNVYFIIRRIMIYKEDWTTVWSVQVGIIGRNQAVEDVAFVLFSVFNVIWATVYLETWKRRGAELAYRWGTLDQRDDLLVEPRPLFTVRTFWTHDLRTPISAWWRRSMHPRCATTAMRIRVTPSLPFFYV